MKPEYRNADSRQRWVSRWIVAALSLAAIPDSVRAQALRDDCAERLDRAARVQSHLGERLCVTPAATELLRDIGNRLPYDTALQRFSLIDGEVQIQGLSPDVPKLVQLLQRSDVIESPAVQGALMPDATRRKDMFVISAKVRRLQKSSRESQGIARLFLPEDDFDAAAAGLSQRLAQVVSSQTDDPSRCRLIQNQPARSSESEAFERVTIKARLRCDWQILSGILHELETTAPALFVDQMTIWKQSGYRAPEDNAVVTFLDAHLDVYGYIRGHSASPAPDGEPSARSAPPAGSPDPFDEVRVPGR